MNFFVALLFLIIGTANGWALREWWVKRQAKNEMPFGLNLKCPVHGLVINYKASDEFAAIRMMEKWDENHGSCAQKEVE